LIGGHEGAGYIVALGEHSDTDLKVGDKVGIKWIASSCNRCSFCRQGYEPLCKSALCSGFTVDGSFQQCAVSYTSQLSLIPDNLSLADVRDSLQAQSSLMCRPLRFYAAALRF
jgi:propanol-preferring alcohol dehydrogenase